ncbi:MAG TPA: hypothetical protein VIQ98_03130 [Gemmatimonadales bacterium]
MSWFSGMRLLLAAVVGSAAATGCKGVTEPYQDELALLRSATQGFAEVTSALAAGYTLQLTGCMSDPTLGGMGFHIGNPDRTNGTVELERPEVLLYEPQADGVRELVAVEYIVPFAAWTAEAPPTLMGQTFKRNEEFGVWALHVWLYRENPTGIFSDWNPRVSCTVGAPVEMRGA